MYCGWIDSRIGYLIESHWGVFRELPYCLVTCVDCSRDIRFMMTTEMTKRIGRIEDSCSFLGTGLVVGGARIADIAKKYRLFNGCDEIWLYMHEPTIEKPAALSIVSPRVDLGIDPPEQLSEWFDASGCVLGMGDGEGMNYVAAAEHIVESLKAHVNGGTSGQGGDGVTS